MTILGNIKNLTEEQENNQGYTVPAVIRPDKTGISFKSAMWISTLLHPTIVGLAALLSFILLLLGINLFTFERPKAKIQDIEFVLVDKEATPINKRTPYRSDKNSRAGGKHDPKRKVSMPSPQPTKQQSPAKAASASQAKQQPKNIQKPKQSQTPKPTETPRKTQTAQQPSPQPTQAKPQPPSARPSLAPPATPKLATTPKSAFTVPVPPSPNTGKLSTGPVGGQGKTTSATGGGGSYAPTPSLAPSYGGSSGSSGGRSASRGGYGNAGNPGPGNPNGRPGIDSIKEPDFGPYMRDLQRRIKQNWDPPKGNESKRVVLLFKIAKDGRLLSSKVFKSSGMPVADNAAIQAVQLTAPFRPLPPEFKGSSIDIQFTFDYNVFGATGY